jgi:hypothetical protein
MSSSSFQPLISKIMDVQLIKKPIALTRLDLTLLSTDYPTRYRYESYSQKLQIQAMSFNRTEKPSRAAKVFVRKFFFV